MGGLSCFCFVEGPLWWRGGLFLVHVTRHFVLPFLGSCAYGSTVVNRHQTLQDHVEGFKRDFLYANLALLRVADIKRLHRIRFEAIYQHGLSDTL